MHKKITQKIKVRLNCIDRDNVREIWESEKINGKLQYFERSTPFGKDWYYITSDYFETDYRVPDNIIFIVCDKKWNECCRDGNWNPRPFITLEALWKSQWQSIKQQYPNVTKEGFSDWIWSKMPDTIYKYGTDAYNWRDFNNTILKSESLHSFSWLNQQYNIIRVTKQHTKCDAQWAEYYIGRDNLEKYESYESFLGYEFDKNS